MTDQEKNFFEGKLRFQIQNYWRLFLGSGNTEESAVELAQKILKSVDNNWQNLSLLSIKDLMKFKGIIAKSHFYCYSAEIGRRKASQEIPEN